MWLRLAALGPHTCPTVPQGLPLEGTSRRYALSSWRESPSGLRMSLPEMLQMLIPWVWGTACESAGLSSSQVRPRLLGPSRAQSSGNEPEPSAWLDLPSLVSEAARSHRPPPPPQREACAPAVHVCIGGGQEPESPVLILALKLTCSHFPTLGLSVPL